MDFDSILKTKKCLAIDTNKRIFTPPLTTTGVRSQGWLNSYLKVVHSTKVTPNIDKIIHFVHQMRKDVNFIVVYILVIAGYAACGGLTRN